MLCCAVLCCAVGCCGVGQGLNPHFFCLPILKKEDDRKALLEAATSGDARFFAGQSASAATGAPVPPYRYGQGGGCRGAVGLCCVAVEMACRACNAAALASGYMHKGLEGGRRIHVDVDI